MGKEEMAEIGSIIADVVKGTEQAPTQKDPSVKSKAKYIIKPGVKEKAIERVKAIMDRFPVYPQLDLDLLKKAFVE
jgi:glycine hydroxymethyltransferase